MTLMERLQKHIAFMFPYQKESDQGRLLIECERELNELTEQLEHALNPVHSCGPTCQRPACVIRRERDQFKQAFLEAVRCGLVLKQELTQANATISEMKQEARDIINDSIKYPQLKIPPHAISRLESIINAERKP